MEEESQAPNIGENHALGQPDTTTVVPGPPTREWLAGFLNCVRLFLRHVTDEGQLVHLALVGFKKQHNP